MIIKKISGKPTSNLYPTIDIQEIELSRIGVIIPAYQAEATIDSLITSLHTLGFPKKNIIVIDDGSTDETYNIAKNLGVRVQVD